MGNAFPRFSARRRIPLQAFGERKYLAGTLPVSRMSDRDVLMFGFSDEITPRLKPLHVSKKVATC
jgi:hypothetical protein